MSTIVDVAPYALATLAFGLPSAICKYLALRRALIDVPPEGRVEILRAFAQVLNAWRWR